MGAWQTCPSRRVFNRSERRPPRRHRNDTDTRSPRDTWTDAMVARLRELCAQKEPTLTTREMAAILCREYPWWSGTKQAVKAKAFREKIPLPTPAPQAKVKPEPQERRVVLYDLPEFRARQSFLEDTGGPGIPFLNAGHGECRNPLPGTSGLTMRVCGEPTQLGYSYCSSCKPKLYLKKAVFPDPLPHNDRRIW